MDGSAQMAAVEERRLPFSFSGNAWDYFKICLRTYLLALLTLGIYDAWGTVERRRYMLGHTKLDGHGFDYHAKPLWILLSRLILLFVIADLVLFGMIWQVETILVGIVVFIVLMPWMVNSAYRFQLRNLSYRNLYFDFRGSYLQAFLRYLLAPIFLMALTLGLIYPVLVKWQATYAGNHAKYGSAPFSMNIRISPVYWVMLVSVLIIGVFFGAYVVFVGAAVVSLVNGAEADAEEMMGKINLVDAAFNFAYILLLGFTASAMRGAIRSAVLNGMSLEGGHRFQSTLRPWRYAVFVTLSWAAAALSLGLAGPWAHVRIRRYELERTAMLAQGDLDTFTGKIHDAGDAIGAEIGILEGLAGAGF